MLVVKPQDAMESKMYVYIGGWGVLNREIVSFRSCVRTCSLVA